MCGRFTQRSEGRRLVERFAVQHALFRPRPRFNVAPTQPIAVVTLDDGRRVLRAAEWGLTPAWAHGGNGPGGLINARAESVATKPSFRDAFARRRCLIPADGFYEWRKDAGGKTPMFIHLADDAPFAFAGLWEPGPPPDADADEPPPTATIITTQANELCRSIHPRMPVLLPREAEAQWLDPGEPSERLLALLRPYEASKMAAHPVSRRVNKPSADDAHLIDRVDEEAGVQKGLFDG